MLAEMHDRATAATIRTDRAALADALVRVAGGSEAALSDVYQRTSAKLFGICLRILVNRSDAEDVLQDIYINIWRKAGSFDPGRASPITWLAAIARNRAIDRLRSRADKRQRPLEEGMDVPDPKPDATRGIEDRQERARLDGCIGELEGRQAGAIRTAFFQGMTYAELAERESVPLGTMKSWVRRGLARLRDCLER